MNISIFGLGYVGCVSLGCLAQNGHKTTGVDIQDHKVNLINQGKPTIIEKDIDHIIKEQFEKDRISATKNAENAVINSDISIIAVGTPSSSTGHLNLDYVYRTAQNIGKALKSKDSFHVVAIRSTVMPGTNKQVAKILEESSGKQNNKDFAVISNPEFLREGSAVKDYYNPAVTVLGGESEKGLKMMEELYNDLPAPVKKVPIKVAEIIKYVNNSWHALKISFANEVGNICKQLEIDSHKVMDLFCMDTQLNLSPYYLKPGFAYGGSCLPKDLKGLNTMAHDYYLDSPVLNSIHNSNEKQKQIAFELISGKNKKHIGILGLSFKKGTDDLRYSPIVEVTEQLLGKGYEITIYDEKVNLSKITGTNKAYIEQHIPHLSKLIKNNLDDVIKNSDVIVINQNDPKFREIPVKHPDKIIVDLIRIADDIQPSNYEGINW
jgi:GDP-mannose 6-dehydrogenase